MPRDDPGDTLSQLQLRTFDDALGRRIIDTHIWAVREGLRGADAYELFDGYCQRLVIHGTPLWRAHTAMETLAPAMERIRLHLAARPQRDRPRAIRPWQPRRSRLAGQPLESSHRQGPGRRGESRRCAGVWNRVETSATSRFLRNSSPKAGRTTSLISFAFGKDGDRSQGTGVVYSFATDRKGGFNDDDTTLVQATLPALVAGHEGARRPRHRVGTAPDLSRRRRGAARPRRLGHAGFGRSICTPCCGTPTSAASRGSATRRRVPSSSNCSTMCSRS